MHVGAPHAILSISVEDRIICPGKTMHAGGKFSFGFFLFLEVLGNI